jgi:hypothetical protein
MNLPLRDSTAPVYTQKTGGKGAMFDIRYRSGVSPTGAAALFCRIFKLINKILTISSKSHRHFSIPHQNTAYPAPDSRHENR